MSIRVPLATVLLAFAACRGAVERTAPASEERTAAGADIAITRVAFGSCAFQWVEEPIFRTVVAANPDLYLSLGDAVYGDFDGEKTFDVTPESLRAEWQKLAESPDWKHLKANVPVMATWENHDYGHHSAGAEFPLKAQSQEIFLDFFGKPEDSERRQTPGVCDAAVLGPQGRRVSKTDEGPYPLFDLTSSGLTHVNKEYPKAPNRYRIAGPFVDLNVGVVEIDWETGPSPLIRMKALGLDGRRAFEHTVALGDLAPPSGVTPKSRASGREVS